MPSPSQFLFPLKCSFSLPSVAAAGNRRNKSLPMVMVVDKAAVSVVAMAARAAATGAVAGAASAETGWRPGTGRMGRAMSRREIVLSDKVAGQQ